MDGDGKSTVTPKDPYRLNFTYAAIPSTPDHSKSNPGPAKSGANRAGYTRATLNKHAAAEWDHGPARADGSVPLFATAVTVDFTLDPITVAVSSDYDKDSCPYKVTLKHEIDDHVKSYIKIFLSYHDRLVNALNTITFPTKSKPKWIKPQEIDTFQDALGEQLRQVILDVSGKLKDEMDADRKAKDSPDAYKAIYRQCSEEEWQS